MGFLCVPIAHGPITSCRNSSPILTSETEAEKEGHGLGDTGWAPVGSHHCQRHLQEFCGSTQPVLFQPSDPLTPSPPQMSFPKATVQKLRGTSPWELFLAVFQLLDWASLVAQLVENPPAMRETWARSLHWEDPLEQGKAIRSSILAWRIPRTV